MAEKVIRCKVDEAVWKSFRILAIQNDRTVTEYLSELVTKEVARHGRKAQG